MYDVNSKCADDFINHEEILDTLSYADENKENIELIDALIEKAKKEKGFPTGRHPFFWPVPLKRKTRKSMLWLNRSKKIFTGTGLLCSLPFICPTTA